MQQSAAHFETPLGRKWVLAMRRWFATLEGVTAERAREARDLMQGDLDSLARGIEVLDAMFGERPPTVVRRADVGQRDLCDQAVACANSRFIFLNTEDLLSRYFEQRAPRRFAVRGGATHAQSVMMHEYGHVLDRRGRLAGSVRPAPADAELLADAFAVALLELANGRPSGL